MWEREEGFSEGRKEKKEGKERWIDGFRQARRQNTG